MEEKVFREQLKWFVQLGEEREANQTEEARTDETTRNRVEWRLVRQNGKKKKFSPCKGQMLTDKKAQQHFGAFWFCDVPQYFPSAAHPI